MSGFRDVAYRVSRAFASGASSPLRIVTIAAALVTPVTAAAQCQDPPVGAGGLVTGLAGVLPASSGRFETSSNGVVYSGSVEVKDAGCQSTQLSVRVSAALQGEVRTPAGSRSPVGGAIDARLGAAYEFELALPNGAWRGGTPPNPFDPNSIPPGGTMILRREAFAALGLEANYKLITASSNIEEGAGSVVAIQRTDDGQVRVMVGPYSVIRNESMIGLGRGSVRVGLGRDDKLDTGSLRAWTLDPGSNADMRTYRGILGQGAVVGAAPLTERPSDRVEYATYESTSGIRMAAGPVSLAANFGMSTGDVRVVTRPDGSRTYTAVSNYNGTILTVTREYGPDGRQTRPDNTTVAFTRISDWDGYMLDIATGKKPLGDDDWKGKYPNGTKLDITPDNWQQWRDRARDYVNSRTRIGAPPVHIEMIADAKSPLDVAMALYRVGSGPYTRTFEDLFDLSQFQGGQRTRNVNPLPGNAGPACTPGRGNGAGNAAQANARALAGSVAASFCGSNVNLFASTNPTPASSGTAAAGGAAGAGMRR